MKASKDGRIPEEWKDKPAKLRQKDRDARWRVKFSKAKEPPDGTRPSDLRLSKPRLDRQGFGFIRQWG